MTCQAELIECNESGNVDLTDNVVIDLLTQVDLETSAEMVLMVSLS